MNWLFAAILAQSLDAGMTCGSLAAGKIEMNPILGQSCGRMVATKLSISSPLLLKSVRASKAGKVLIGALIVAGSIGTISNVRGR